MKIFFSCMVFFLFNNVFAQVNAHDWNGKKCAVVLTYDDGYNEQLDNAIPVLDSLKLRATFYLSGYFPAVRNRLNEWRKVAKKGYELGNHTLFHPCIGSGKGREWVSKENDLSKYTVERMTNEIRMTNVFLQALDGKTKRTFAYTCGDMKIADSFFLDGMKNEFVAARAVRNEMHKINEIDLYNVDCFMVNGETAKQMIDWVKKAVANNSLLVILFHGVGGGNGLNVSLDDHRKLLCYLQKNQKDIYVAPMVEVAEQIKKWEKNQGN